MKEPKMTIVPDTEDLEILASSIVAVAEGARRLKASRLKDRAILLLIRDSIPGTMKIALSDIQNVLDAAANLDVKFLKKI